MHGSRIGVCAARWEDMQRAIRTVISMGNTQCMMDSDSLWVWLELCNICPMFVDGLRSPVERHRDIDWRETEAAEAAEAGFPRVVQECTHRDQLMKNCY